MCGIMLPEQFGYGHVGSPVPCVELRLVDVPDAGYFSTNPKPQGEVWVRGPAITKGYWKRDDVTKETLTEDGWLQTGDIAEWNANGTLTIIDRKKNLVKLSNGEYIALEKLESVYKSCIHVNNLCVYGDSLCARPVATVVPAEPAVRELAKSLGVESNDWEDICSNKQVKQAVLKSLLDQGKEAGLKPAELLFDIYLCPEEWTVDSVMDINSESYRLNLTRVLFSRVWLLQLKRLSVRISTSDSRLTWMPCKFQRKCNGT